MEIVQRVMPLDIPSEDGTIYPKDIVEDGILHFVKRLGSNNECIAGESKQPEQQSDDGGDRWQIINPRWISHVVKHLWIENGYLLVKLKLLGKYREAAEEGMEWNVTPRAVGIIEKGVATSFHLITVDLAYREHPIEE